MELHEYQEKVMEIYSKTHIVLQDNPEYRAMYLNLGLSSEVGEIQDLLLKSIRNRTRVDWIDLLEELGDLFWYMAAIANERGIRMEDILDFNINKLKDRYPYADISGSG